MLLSLQELIVWTGLGPFEAALHSFALLIFTFLTTLQLEGVVDTSWHAIFSPLYVALGIHSYYATVLSVRMLTWGLRHTSKRALLYIIVSSALGIGLLIYVEFSIAGFLNGDINKSSLITSVVLLICYLLARIVLVFRALYRPHFAV